MTVGRTWGVVLTGLHGDLVEVEADLSNQTPAFVIIGLADKAVGEAHQRVHNACANSDLPLPRRPTPWGSIGGRTSVQPGARTLRQLQSAAPQSGDGASGHRWATLRLNASGGRSAKKDRREPARTPRQMRSTARRTGFA